MKSNHPIGVFDSGVGGLSVLIELQKILPSENFIFLADQLYVPYGEKTKKELIGRCLKIADYFLNHHDVKMLVVACNTATCGAIEEMRAKYELPIVGTVPAVKVAAESTKSKIVAIISTPSTSKSEALKKLIKNNCQNINVLNIGCKDLANMVDEGKINTPEVNNLLLKYLKKVRNSKADYVVLGCTQYPFLKKPIQKILGPKVKLLESGKAVAKYTKSLVSNNHIKNSEKSKGKTLYFTTLDSGKFSKVASLLLKRNIKAKKVKI